MNRFQKYRFITHIDLNNIAVLRGLIPETISFHRCARFPPEDTSKTIRTRGCNPIELRIF